MLNLTLIPEPINHIPRKWADPILRASTAKSLLKSPNHLLLALGKPPAQAYVLAHLPPHAVADILTLYTPESIRRQGYARILLQVLITHAKNAGCTGLTLEVRLRNHAAIMLYQSLGFKKVATRKAYYQNPTEDALVLTLNFS
ncbi:MAG: GNAT family N-acetyltransferase [Proteobacteria bacterium]|nr:GNAT family N-acetyltransferase [Pseudomonadota bacterium]